MLILNMLSNHTVVELLTQGAVGVLPTDTVYGLACRASDSAAVTRLYELKHRHQKPGTILAASIEQLIELGIKARYLKPVQHYWPNSLSIIVPSEPVLAYLDMGKRTLAVRIPKHPSLQALLKSTGPLLTSSANQPGMPVARTVSEAVAYFGGELDFYVDGGDLSAQLPSTIIRIIDDEVAVIRQGAVKINAKGEMI